MFITANYLNKLLTDSKHLSVFWTVSHCLEEPQLITMWSCKLCCSNTPSHWLFLFSLQSNSWSIVLAFCRKLFSQSIMCALLFSATCKIWRNTSFHELSPMRFQSHFSVTIFYNMAVKTDKDILGKEKKLPQP